MNKNEIEVKLDIQSISDTHYLLEAGKNRWRLNEIYYCNPKAVLVYALSLLYNNSFDNLSQEKLESLNIKMRLTYLLYLHSDKNKPQKERYQQLVNKFLKRVKKIPKKLQEEYKMDTQEIDLMDKIIPLLNNS